MGRRIAYHFAVWCRWVALCLMVIIGIGVSKKLPTDQPPGTSIISPDGWAKIIDLQAWFLERSWLLPALVGVWGASTRIRDHLGAPRFWKLVNRMLTRFRDEAFEGSATAAPLHRHRATLFIEKSGWLRPVARAGDGARCSTSFEVRDGMNANSVAAAVYHHHRVIPINDLPELTADASQETINQYAERSFAPPQWIRQRLKENKQCSRAFLGIPIEINYRVRGVLLIDSLHPALPSPQVTAHKFQSLALALGLLLESEGSTK
jgi:hypothetical protein